VITRVPDSFTTERLTAVRVGPADEEFLVAMWSDPRVVATLGGARDREQVRTTIERLDAHWEAFGHGMWILRDRATGAPVGWTMLTVTDVGGPGGVEVGWSVAADRWREGLASEAAAEAVRLAFTDLGRDDVVTFTLVDNVASQGVMRRLGFTYEADVEHAGLPHVLYRLTKKDWEANG
jgi:[ribosomal protein S5]-alanine N-acetyltransferase